MTPAHGRPRVAAAIVLLLVAGAQARPAPCRRGADASRIVAALERIRRSVDPCGESAQLIAVLDRFERCTRGRYDICTDETASRNLLEPHGTGETGTIIWNPDLRSVLEPGCDGDPTRQVMRDPVASLLHELVHAADACEGLDPAARELEAVRLENVYRRAAGLCQRSAYGDHALPVDTLTHCEPPPVLSTADDREHRRETPRPAADGQAAESAPEGDLGDDRAAGANLSVRP